MESLGIKLTDAEQQFYGQLFATIDAENVGKVSSIKAIHLLNCSQLSSNVVDQVSWQFENFYLFIFVYF
jgi:hypothetical protein